MYKNKVKQIFFDCDNTLIATEEVSFEAAATVVSQFLDDFHIEREYSNEELMFEYFGLTVQQMITKLATKHKVTVKPEQTKAYAAFEEEIAIDLIYQRCRPCPGADNVVEQLHDLGEYKLAVVSSSPIKRVRAALEAGGIAQFFEQDQIFSAKHSMPIAKSKPDPAIYRWAMARNKVQPHECITIEDSRSGARSAIDAGIATIAYVGAYRASHQRDQVAKLLHREGCRLIMHDFDREFFPCLEKVRAELECAEA